MIQPKVTRQRRISLILPALAVMLIVPSFLMLHSPTEAHLSFGGYIYNTSYARKDPINLLFAGNATEPNVYDHFRHHLWWSSTDGSTMYFIDHDGFRTMDYQLASEPAYSPFPRYHIRWKQGLEPDCCSYGTYTTAAAHQDKIVADLDCQYILGHRGHNFNLTRDFIAAYFESGGHGVSWDGWWMGNTLGSTNCDGSVYYGDGWLHILWI